MADRFLNSVDGSDANSGADWNNEKLTLVTGIAAIDAAGDRVLINSAHTETAASISYTCPGTNASPMQFLSVTPTGTSGISSLTAGAAFTANSGSGGLAVNGSGYFYGINWTMSSTSSTVLGFAGGVGDHQVHDTGQFNLTSSGGSSNIQLGNATTGGGSRVLLKNCTFRFGATGHRISFLGDVVVQGGSWSASGTLNPGAIFAPAPGSGTGRGSKLLVDGFDFSNLNAAINLAGSGQGGVVMTFRNCKLPASWSGAPIADGSLVAGQRVEMYNCDNADTNYRLWVKEYTGSIRDETTIVRSGGASDGTTPISWKMDTTANVAYPTSVLRSPEIAVWNDTSGTSKTVTVEMVHDTNVAAGQGAGTSFAFRDDEVWLEVQYLGDGTRPISTFVSDAPTNIITTAADQASSSVTWTTTGMTTPVKQKLSVTFTPQEKGWFICTVCVGKASKTLYVCPKADIT